MAMVIFSIFLANFTNICLWFYQTCYLSSMNAHKIVYVSKSNLDFLFVIFVVYIHISILSLAYKSLMTGTPYITIIADISLNPLKDLFFLISSMLLLLVLRFLLLLLSITIITLISVHSLICTPITISSVA